MTCYETFCEREREREHSSWGTRCSGRKEEHSSCRNPTIKDVQWVQEPLLSLLPLLWSSSLCCVCVLLLCKRIASTSSRFRRKPESTRPRPDSKHGQLWPCEGHLLQVIMCDSDGCITEGTQKRMKPDIIFGLLALVAEACRQISSWRWLTAACRPG